MTRRRIMLAELRPLVPGSRTNVEWSTTDKSSEVAVSSGNTLATTSGDTVYQSIRAAAPCGTGLTYWETAGSITSGLTDVRAGIAVAAFPLSDQALGDAVDGLSAGGPDRYGQCWYRGVLVATLSGMSSGVRIRHLINREKGTYAVAVAGGAWTTIVADPRLMRRDIYPAASLVNGSVRMYAPADFLYAVPGGADAGVFTTSATAPTTVYLSSHPFGTYAGDDPPNQLYLARFDGQSDLVISRSASCWVWGNQSQSERGTLTVLNGDRRFDEWITGGWIWRDAAYTILAGYEGDARADFTVYARGVIDQIELDGDRRIIVTLANPLARLDRPVQTKLYTNATNAQAVDKPKPIAIGRPLYVPGVLLSTTEFGPLAWNYDAHESAIAGMDALYDRGDIFEPIDWEYLPSGAGIRLLNKPQGKVCFCPRGATLDDGAALLDTDFASLTGWGNESTGSATVTTSGTTARWQSGTSEFATLRRPGLLSAHTGLVRIDVVVTTIAGGSLVLRTDPSQSIRTIRTAGTLSAIIDATGEDDVLLYTAGVADINVASILVTPVRLAETLPDCMRYLLIDKAGLDEIEVDWDSIDALHALAPYRIADYIDSDETIIAVLRRWLDSWCGFVTVNRLGQITVGRIGDLAKDPALRLSTLNVKSVDRRLDEAKGLTTRLAGGKNYSVHSDGDLATSVPLPLREILKAEYTQIRSSVAAVVASGSDDLQSATSRTYKHADGAPYQVTALQSPADLQVEINRVAQAWALDKGRWFYDSKPLLAAATGDAVEPGQTDSLAWPTYGMAGGREIVATAVTTRFFGRVIDLTSSDFEG